jgi:hypothetical protein
MISKSAMIDPGAKIPAGTNVSFPQSGHRTVLPASESAAVITARQDLQRYFIG